mmetsp:Transcript_30058/g.75665  ORF Transcript_30058/g.75665 Transcript_30058/m.75665 type:complete len:428 (+) Transcript_30058:60-1343(+)
MSKPGDTVSEHGWFPCPLARTRALLLGQSRKKAKKQGVTLCQAGHFLPPFVAGGAEGAGVLDAAQTHAAYRRVQPPRVHSATKQPPPKNPSPAQDDWHAPHPVPFHRLHCSLTLPTGQSYVSFTGDDDGVGSSRRFTSKLATFNPFKGDASAPFDTSESVMAAQKEMRLGFIRKVYGILSAQLLATVLVCAIALKATSPTPVGSWQVLSFGSFLASSQGFSIFVFVFSVAVLISLFCLRHSYPLNMILLSVWTLAMSFTVATSCAMAVCDPMVTTSPGGAPTPLSLATSTNLQLAGGQMTCAVGTPYALAGGNSVLMATAMTAGLFLALTVFTFQSKWDFSFLGAGLFAAVWILLIWGIVMACFGGSPAMQYWYCLIGAVLFSLYIVFDTWMLSKVYGPDDYIAASISLYLDIINLFLMILSLLRRD